MADLKPEDIRYGRRTGDSLEYLYVSYEEKLLVAVGINPKSGWIASFEGSVIDGDGRLVYKHLFFDLTKQDGFLVPHQSIFVSMGLMVGESSLDRVEINPKTPDGYYKPL